jgi:hypothetical protein
MLQAFWETLPMATKHGCMAMSPKQKPSHRFGNLFRPHSRGALAKFKARQKYFFYYFQLDAQYCQFYKLFMPLHVSGDIRPSSGGPCY